LASQRKINASFFNLSLKEFCDGLGENEKFDVVTMFEVFEHVDNPHETLVLIKSILKENGAFIGSLPDEERLLSKKLNLDYALPPYHLTYWTQKSWADLLLNKYGFKTTVSSSNIYYGYLSNISKIKLLTNLNLINKKKNIINIMVRTFFYITGMIEKPIERLLGKGSSFYFETTKTN